MIRKIPIVATPIYLREILISLRYLLGRGKFQEELKNELASFINKKYLFLLNSGTASFFVILEALKKNSSKKEVILPAYTASSLIIAIKQANLIPVLCDISLDNFNLNLPSLEALITKDTLSILGMHMFGIVTKGLGELKKKFSDIFIVEDCAQSLGSKINGVPVGNSGQISFFSFNRGKNLPTYGGGCIATNLKEISEVIELRVKGLGGNQLTENTGSAFKILILSLVVKPYIYGLLYPLISLFKEKAPHKDFIVKKYTDFQAKIISFLLKRIGALSKKRYENGLKLIERLRDVEGIIFPKIEDDTEPAFNRLPIVFKDLRKRNKVEEKLQKAGIETSRMYLRPLHHIFDLGYKKEDFPNARYFAEHLLTLPTHPLLTKENIDKIVEVIRKS